MENKKENIDKKWKKLRRLGILLIIIGFFSSIILIIFGRCVGCSKEDSLIIYIFTYGGLIGGLIIIAIGIIILFVNKFLYDKK